MPLVVKAALAVALAVVLARALIKEPQALQLTGIEIGIETEIETALMNPIVTETGIETGLMNPIRIGTGIGYTSNLLRTKVENLAAVRFSF